MTIEEFATKNRLQTRRDEEGELIVRCRHGQIYFYSPRKLGVMFLMDSAMKWNNRRKTCEAAGMTVLQDGDCEGTLTFDPDNRDQARAAIRMVGAYRKVELSPELRQAKAERMAQVNAARKLTMSGA
jgi:hypothetical protein